jgi:recombination protein RecT
MPRTNNPTSATSAVARRAQEEREKAGNLARYLDDLAPQIARALPHGLNADRVTRLALTAARRTPALLDCSAESFAGALLTASALGLEPDVNGEAYLIPYGAECTFVAGYQGLAKLFRQSPLARDLWSDTVYEGDDFEWVKGTDRYIRHHPCPADQRGEPTHYYAVAELANGAKPFEVLTADEVKALRGGKVGPDPRFKGGDPMRWMERKTALRQLFKLTPKSTSLTHAIERDERPGTELYRQLRDDPRALEQATPTGGPVEGRVVHPDDGPAYDARTGEVQDDAPDAAFPVQDPPNGGEFGPEPEGWR